MSTSTSITVRVPLAIRDWHGRRTVVTPDGGGRAGYDQDTRDFSMVKALARAFRLKRMLAKG